MNKDLARKRRAAKTKFRTRNATRLVVHKTSRYTYAVIVKRGVKGDEVIVSASSNDKEFSKEKANKCDQAFEVGKLLAARAKEKKMIDNIAFDRNGNKYHGRIAALAKGAREGGLNF